MPQQAALRGTELKPEKGPKLRHVRVEPHGEGVRVKAALEVEGHMLHFHYHAKNEEEHKHEKFVKALHGKAQRWIERYPKFHEKIGHTKGTLKITFAQIAYHGPYDWRLVARWVSGGQAFRREWYHRDPAEIMNPDAMVAAIEAQDALRKGPPDIAKHKEKLRAVFAKPQA